MLYMDVKVQHAKNYAACMLTLEYWPAEGAPHVNKYAMVYHYDT